MRAFPGQFTTIRPSCWRQHALRLGFCLLAVVLSWNTRIAIAAQNDGESSQKRISGFAKSGDVPLPGVSVTALNSATGRQVITSTDVDGSYVLVVPESGSYTLSAQLAAFTPATQTVSIDDTHPSVQANFGLTLLSRTPAAEPKQLITRGAGPASGPDARQNRQNPRYNAGTFNPGMNPRLNSESNAGSNPRFNRESNPGVNQRQAATEGGFLNLPVMEGDSSSDQTDGATGERSFGATANLEAGNDNSPADVAPESVSISGATARMEQLPNIADFRERMQEGGQNMGMPGGGAPGGGPFGGGGGPMIMRIGPGGGGRGRFNINRPHGNVSYTLGDSAFDAKPYSLNGLALPKPSYTQNRFSASVGGPLNIPKLFHGGKSTFFFLSYDGSRSLNPFDSFSTVPTAAERLGDFSGASILSGPNAGSPVQIFDPQTHLPFANNVIPTRMVEPAATRLLNYIPLPNLPGEVQNFHRATSVENDADSINLRVIHNFGGGGPAFMGRGPGSGGRGPGRGRRSGSSINFGFRYHSTGNVLANSSPFVGGNTSVQGIDAPVGYVVTKGRFTNNFRVDFNRNRTSTQNLYAFSQNIAGQAGINGVSQNPFDWGLPNLSLTNFSGLRDITPLLRRDQTFSFGDNIIWTHGQHAFRWGGDFRRIQTNTQTSSNARGSFTFTGFNTAAVSNGTPVPGTGFDLADLLLGLPQQTSAQFGNNAYYFRGNSWDAFLQDEWRMKANLTLNLGLRYEYASPFTEKYGRIVNLDAASGFTAIAPVLPGSHGAYTGSFPASLVNPDRNNFAPRLGLAWKPMKNTVLRLGYSINYNVGAYGAIIQNLAFQPPFSFTQTNVESAAVPLTLENGFPVAPASVTNNYGVNRNYRVGYAQMSSLDLQQQLPHGMMLNLTFSHVKGTNLDMLRAPNRGPSGLLIAGAAPFLWESSEANSTSNSLSVQVRRRFQHGLMFGGRYIFSKSIDNASSIGGGGTVVAQNDRDLSAERGLSSFDQRHRLTVNYMWELPFGTDQRWLNKKGIASDLAGGWQMTGNVTLASGNPFTARVVGSFAEVGRGTNGTLRADATGLPVSIGNPTAALFFNSAAFAVPATGQFGNAARNTIPGPKTIAFNMSINKTVHLGETQALELRAQVNNVFNTPQFTSIDTTVNSPSFGRVLNVGSMRKIQFVARYRF